MAKNSFNFQAKMGLDAKGFRKGVNQVSASLNRLKSTFSSLAAGIGVGLGFERLAGVVKDTALKLDTALNTLKNASTTTKTFKSSIGEVNLNLDLFKGNLSFVKKLSNEYGQDLVSLTDSYANFTAAAKGTNIGLDSQKYIFEQLTRAAGAFHLSADRTSDMLNAVVQMMSKGKVAAEELRRQLGNTLPGAFNIMAAAMGVSTAKLEDMMKKGEVLASEALPAFAAQLERLTKNANFDSLQISMTKFKNAWYDVVEASNSKELFKGLTDIATGILKDISFNFKTYMGTAKGALIAFLAGPPMIKAFKGINDYFKNFRANAELQITAVEARLKSLGDTLSKIGKFSDIATGIFMPKDAEGVDSKTAEMMKEYNQLQLERKELYDDLGQAIISTQTIDTMATQKATQGIEKVIDATKKSERQILVNAGAWTRFKHSGNLAFKGLIKGAMKMGKALIAALGPIALINIALTAIGALVGHIIGKYNQWKAIQEEIADIHGGFDERMTEAMAPTNEEIKRVDKLKKSFIELGEAGNIGGQQELFRQLQEAVPALKELKYEDIVKKADGFDKLTESINLWATALSKGAKFQAALDQLFKAQDDKDKYLKQQEEIRNSGEELEKTVMIPGNMWQQSQYYTAPTEAGLRFKAAADAYGEAVKAEADAREILNELVLKEDDGKEDVKETPLQKLIKKHEKNIKELQLQRREVAKALEGPTEEAKKAVKKAEEEIDEELNKAYIKAFEDAAATGQFVLSDIQNKIANGESLTKLEKWYYDLAQKAAKATADIAAKTAEESAEKGVKAWADKINKKRAELLSELNSDDSEYKPKEVKDRDSRLDYKKTELEISTEQFDVAQERVDAVDEAVNKLRKKFKELYNINPPEDIDEFLTLLNKKKEEFLKEEGKEDVVKLLEKMIGDLKSLQATAKTFEEVKLTEEMIEDLQNLQKELKNTRIDFATGMYSDFAGFVGSIDNVVGAFERLNDVVDDLDSTGWDEFMASFNIFTSIMDSVIGIMETVNTIMELSNTLADLKARKQATLNALTQQATGLEAAKAASTAAAAGASTAAAVASEAEAAASAKNTSAAAGEAIAQATKSGAKVPFPFNILAIAGGVAAVVAALAAINKFEKGGIVGGNSTRGDKNLARLNSGEMVLNKHQQGTLFSAINSGKFGGGGGEWKVRGTDLIKVIDNTRSRQKG